MVGRNCDFLLKFAAFTLGLSFLLPQANAAWEITGDFSYNRVNYSTTGESYSSTQRWGLSVGYAITPLTEVELAFSDSNEKTYIVGYQDTVFHDQIYTANIVQSLAPRGSRIIPFAKVGFGQLNREASGSYAWGSSPPARTDALTAVLGVGLRIFVLQNLALKAEGVTYLRGASISTWKDNVALNFGTTVYF